MYFRKRFFGLAQGNNILENYVENWSLEKLYGKCDEKVILKQCFIEMISPSTKANLTKNWSHEWYTYISNFFWFSKHFLRNIKQFYIYSRYYKSEANLSAQKVFCKDFMDSRIQGARRVEFFHIASSYRVQ